MSKKLNIIGELINNSYARARRSFTDRNLEGFQNLAKIQEDLNADYITLNIDGTAQISVRMSEMLEFLPELVPAVQEASSVPLSFDNPSIEYHKLALKHYDREKSGQPIINSLAASREHLDEMIELVKEYDTKVVVMASEHFVDGDPAQCLDPQDSYRAAKYFVERLVTEADRKLDDIIIDPGLAPVGADTYGLINIGLDAMKLMSADSDFDGTHMVVGLSNFAWGTPKHVRQLLEHAYLTLGMEYGLDFALANPEKNPGPLPSDHELVGQLKSALEEGRAKEGESQEEAGYRQAEAIMDICNSVEEPEYS